MDVTAPKFAMDPFPERNWLHVLLVALLGSCITFAVFLYARSAEERRLVTEFEVTADQPVLEINNLILVNLATVQSLAAFYESSLHVSRREFKAFANSVLSWQHSIQALEWLPKVTRESREAFELAARMDGFPDFRITERGADGTLVPAGVRAEYFPVYYVEPLAGNQAALGFDVMSERTRLAALARARRTGKIAVSDPIPLVQSTSGEYGVLVVVPVYDRPLPRGGPFAPRDELQGYVLAVLQIPKLISGVLDPWMEHRLFGQFQIAAQLENGRAMGVFAQQASPQQPVQAGTPLLYSASTIRVADREWQVAISPPPGWPGPVDLWRPWTTLAAGLLLTLVASVVYGMRLQGIAKLEKMAASLEEKNESLNSVSRTLTRYLPPQVWKSVVDGDHQVSIGARRKPMTIFIGDIVGFTRLSQEMPPDELMVLLNEFFSEMSEIGARHGATLDKFIGDSLMMFFGDPTSKGARQDALACVAMALEMQQRMRILRAKWGAAGCRNPFHMRIGIHSGDCSVGNFGSEDRMSYTVVGLEVNLTARVEKLGEPDGVTITSEVQRHVQADFDCRLVKQLKVKGVLREIQLFAVERKQPKAA